MEALNVQVKEIHLKSKWTEHLNTLTSMGNLTSIYWSQWWWKDMEALSVKVKENCNSFSQCMLLYKPGLASY